MQGFMSQLRDYLTNSSAALGRAAAYSPEKAQQGLPSSGCYESELSRQRRTFRHIEEAAARADAQQQPEGTLLPPQVVSCWLILEGVAEHSIGLIQSLLNATMTFIVCSGPAF